MEVIVQIPGPLGPLEGTLIAPEGAAHIVVILPGSGPTDRDGNGPTLSTNTYRLLAEGLAKHGIASLRVDKRGLFGSAAAIAVPNAVSVADYAADAGAWAAYAADTAPNVWLAGHSEGGLIALAAAHAAGGLILLASPGRPIGRVLMEQLRANPANAPLIEEAEVIVTALETGAPVNLDGVSPPLQRLFAPSILDFLRDIFGHDPVTLARAWRGPAVIVHGDGDLQVSPQDAHLLHAAMPQSHLLTLAGGSHMLKSDVPDAPLATYQDPTLPLHPDLIPGLVQHVINFP